jgi:hypothetical protein
MDATAIVYVDDGTMAGRRSSRERFKRYYEAHKDEFRERNKQKYAEKKAKGFTEDEVKKRREDNRKSYHRRRGEAIKTQLEEMKETADPSRIAVLDELIADNAYSQWGKEVLDVVAFIVKKKETGEVKTNE